MMSRKLNLRNHKIRKDNQEEQDKNCPFAKIQLVRANLVVTYKQHYDRMTLYKYF